MKHFLLAGAGLLLLASCSRNIDNVQTERTASVLAKQSIPQFAEIGSIDIGETGAAEISAFDPITQKLFVVNNTNGNNRIDVVDLVDPASPVLLTSIAVAPYGGVVNSVSVHSGKVAAAVESVIKTNNGRVVVFNTSDYGLMANVEVGAQPDMVTFTPNGQYIITANEGEPNDTYTVDPEGSVSIISVFEGYAVTTLNFAPFEAQQESLAAKGFRIFGPGASFTQDIEPEYVAVAANSATAWVSLQENNAIAKIDIETKTISDIFPLGFKDYSLAENAIDASDRDGGYHPATWPVKGVYMPDGIAVYTDKNVPYIFSANEGDAREWGPYVEPIRVKSAALNAVAFPNPAALKNDAALGRLNITKAMGLSAAGDVYNELYSFGTRSFSIWNGNTGAQVFDSRNELDLKAVEAGSYDDSRSDDKSVEPEGVVLGKVGNRNLLFVGMERADAIAVYDVSNPNKPVYLQWLYCGDAPEGVLFVPASESPNGRSLLIVSSENDGQVKVFATPAG